MFCEFLNEHISELTAAIALVCTDKSPRQDYRILDQIGNIKNQCTSARLSVHQRKAMRNPQHPQSRCRQPISQIIAMVQENIRLIICLWISYKTIHIRVGSGITIKPLGKMCLSS